MSGLRVFSGGLTVNFDQQEIAAWRVIADACEEALHGLDPFHPQRADFVEMWAECRNAAGLPLASTVSVMR